MSGIVFFATQQRDAVVSFYRDVVGASVWLEQPDCTILDYEGFRVGFCERDHTDTDGIVTFVSETRAGVEDAYERVGDAAVEPPAYNDTYEIYQCFAEDPDGRTVEFQTFEHD